MTKDEFNKAYFDFAEQALSLAAKARKNGILDLAGDIDLGKAGNRDIFHYGLQFAVKGINQTLIETILTNIISLDTDEYSRRFKTMQKEAVLHIQDGISPEMLHYILNSLTDIPINEVSNLVEQYIPVEIDTDKIIAEAGIIFPKNDEEPNPDETQH